MSGPTAREMSYLRHECLMLPGCAAARQPSGLIRVEIQDKADKLSSQLLVVQSGRKLTIGDAL